MVTVHRGSLPKQRFVHLDPPANLDRTNGIGRDRLIHVAEPSEARWCAARATLGDAVGLQRARGLEDRLVNFAHGVHGIVRRFMVMAWVVTEWRRIDIVEFVTVEVPISDEPFGQLLVVGPHFRQRGTQGSQVPRHPRWLAAFIENQPVRMVLGHLGHDKLAPAVAVMPVFNPQRQPPELDLDALLVEPLDHVLDGVSDKRRLARLPITVVIEPAVVEGGPVNSQLFELGNCVEHLFWCDRKFVTPTAPAYGVVFVIVGRAREPLFFNRVGPQMQWFIEIAGIDREKSAGCGIHFAWLEPRLSWNADASFDPPVARSLHWD